MLRKLFFGIVLLVFFISNISCSQESVEVNLSSAASQETEAIHTEKVTEISNSSAPAATEQPGYFGDFKLPVEGSRPFAVMIDNEGTRSLPQGGLNMAQIIYEIIVEGGETRLMPVFWDVNPTMIGSVRSARHYFLDYAMENDAIYVHFGWSPMAKKDISALRINNINGLTGAGVIFWDLTKDRNNWQDSYTSMEKIIGYVNKLKYRTTTDKTLLFKYNNEVISLVSGEKAEKVSIKYSNAAYSAYEYDSKKGTYKRFRKGKAHMERVSNMQLEAMNILVQYTPNKTIKGDKSGRQEVITAGRGFGYYITQGKAIKIKWSKKSRSAQTEYFDEAGNKLILNPGQTWIQVMPTTGKVTIE